MNWYKNSSVLAWIRDRPPCCVYDDVIKWKHFPRFWPFVRGIHQSPVSSPHKGQWRGALMFSPICAWINGWVNNREAGDLRHHRAHYDVIVMNFGLALGNSICLTYSSTATEAGYRLNIKTVFPGMGTLKLNIRRSLNRLIFNMRIPILVRRHLYFETAPRAFDQNLSLQNTLYIFSSIVLTSAPYSTFLSYDH